MSSKVPIVIPDIGQRLRQERRRLGLSQEMFGEIAGIKRTVVGFFERGVAVPRTEYLSAWAASGLDVVYVLFGVRADQLAVSALSPDLTERAFLRIEEFENEIGHALEARSRAKIFLMVLAAFVSDQVDDTFSENLRSWTKEV